MITIPQLEESRGNNIRILTEEIQRMCQNGLASMIDSIQPILTKVRPQDEIDIEEIKYNLKEIFMNQV